MPRWFLSLKNHLNTTWLLLSLFTLGAIVNFLGALGPELGFDALWYHLTLPKLWLSMGKITYIPGGLLYYSAMPRLGEFLYIFPLKYFSEVGPHVVNWVFGIGTAVLTYKIAQKFLPKNWSLLAAIIFYITPLVGWQSGSGYVELIWTFFVTAAFYLLLEKKHFLTGILIGLAISTKTLAVGSLPVLIVISFFLYRDPKAILRMVFSAFIVSAPWFIYSFTKTGYPFYPIGAGVLDATHQVLPGLVNPLSLIGDYYKLFLAPDDFLSPVFILLAPLLLVTARKFKKNDIALSIFWVLSYLVWWSIPRTGGGRFILPLIPIWSVLVAVTISRLTDKTIKITILVAVIFSITLNLLLRLGAVSRLTPYLLGQESKESYLCRHLDFKTSVFVDCDGWYKLNLKKTDLVLTSGIHNLFYINFPFVDASWYQDENYTHIIVPVDIDPQTVNFKAKPLRLLHKDKIVGVSLYVVYDIQYALR